MVNQRLQAVDPRIIVLLLFGAFIIIRHIPRPPSVTSAYEHSRTVIFWGSTSADTGRFYEMDIKNGDWPLVYNQAGLRLPKDSVFSSLPTNLSAHKINSQKAPEQMALPPEAAPFFFKPIPINTTSAELLTVIPGIGRNLAAEIIRYRQKNGQFKDIFDLEKIHGIGPLKSRSIEKFIRF